MPTTDGRTSAQWPRLATADMEFRLEVPCDHDAPAAVRQGLRKLDGIGAILSDAMLVASELVSNAVRHSGARERDRLTVEGKVGRQSLRISVLDPGRSGRAARPRSGAPHSGGFGLRLVEQLATRWGSDRAGGHRVWAELAVPD